MIFLYKYFPHVLAMESYRTSKMSAILLSQCVEIRHIFSFALIILRENEIHWSMLQRTVFVNKIRMLQRTVFINKIRMLQRRVFVNKIRMLQRTVFVNKIRMLQRTVFVNKIRMLKRTVFVNKIRILQRKRGGI